MTVMTDREKKKSFSEAEKKKTSHQKIIFFHLNVK